MADSSRAPIKDALKVIMTEQDTLGTAVGTKRNSAIVKISCISETIIFVSEKLTTLYSEASV